MIVECPAESRGIRSVIELCIAFSFSLNGYRAWKRGGTPSRKRLTDTPLITLIRSIHDECKGASGSPRMLEELRSRGLPAGKERVERLMRDSGRSGNGEHWAET